MDAFKFSCLFSLVPVSGLLAISFFVLFVQRKADVQWLKVFGYVVVAFLWVSAFVILSSGVYIYSLGRYHSQQPMYGMPGMNCPMKDMMRGHGSMMMPKQCPGLAEKAPQMMMKDMPHAQRLPEQKEDKR